MKEGIEGNPEKNQEKLSIELSGKELAHLLVNIRVSIRRIEKAEQDRQKYFKETITSPFHSKEQVESIKEIERILSSNAPKTIDENIIINLSPAELNYLLFEIDQRIDSIKTDRMVGSVEALQVVRMKERTIEEEREREERQIEELEILRGIRFKLQRLIRQKERGE